MGDLIGNAPRIIEEAAKSTLGLLALIVLVLGVLAFFFFRGASERARVGVFALMLAGAAGFGVAAVRAVPEGARDTLPRRNWPAGNAVVISGKDFLESSILVELMARVVESDNPKIQVKRIFGKGETTDNYVALREGQIDVYPEYTGTLLAQILRLPPRDVRDPALHRRAKINELLQGNDQTRQLLWLEGFGFSNSFSLIMRRDKAQALGILDEGGAVTISRLSSVASELTFRSTFSFLQRPDGLAGLEKDYRLFFKSTDTILHRNKYEALRRGEVDVTDGYETDPQLHDPEGRLVKLEDDRGFFPKYYAAPFVNRARLGDSRPELAPVLASLRKLAERVNEKDMSAMLRAGIAKGLDKADLDLVTEQRKLTEIVDGFLKAKRLL